MLNEGYLANGVFSHHFLEALEKEKPEGLSDERISKTQ
jgi:hypothetical protein